MDLHLVVCLFECGHDGPIVQLLLLRLFKSGFDSRIVQFEVCLFKSGFDSPIVHYVVCLFMSGFDSPIVHFVVCLFESGQWHLNPPFVLTHLAQGSQVADPSSHSFSSAQREPYSLSPGGLENPNLHRQ